MLLHDMAAGYYDAAALIQGKIAELRTKEQTPEVRLHISRLRELKKEVRCAGLCRDADGPPEPQHDRLRHGGQAQKALAR